MAKLGDIFNKIDENGGDISFQTLNACCTNVKNKQGGNEVTFVTQELSAHDVMTNTGKHGFIVWVDPDDYKKAFNELEHGINHDNG